MKTLFCILTPLLALITGCNPSDQKKTKDPGDSPKAFSPNLDTGNINLTSAEWRSKLPKEVFDIAIEKGTEPAFSGKYNIHKAPGTYYCAVCGSPLFSSNGKFESNCGWPSFFEPINKESIIFTPDTTQGMKRTEVQCGMCKSHLGHVFEDGPPPTGLRYCINSVILNFEDAKKAKKNFTK